MLNEHAEEETATHPSMTWEAQALLLGSPFAAGTSGGCLKQVEFKLGYRNMQKGNDWAHVSRAMGTTGSQGHSKERKFLQQLGRWSPGEPSFLVPEKLDDLLVVFLNQPSQLEDLTPACRSLLSGSQ